MKNVALIIVILGFIGIGGCQKGQNSSSEDENEKPKGTIIFVDATAIRASSKDETVESDFRKQINKVVDNRLNDYGSWIKVYPIRKQTEVKFPQMEIKNNIKPVEGREYETDKTIAEAKTAREMNSFVRKAKKNISTFLKKVKEISEELEGPKSDIFGSVEVIRQEAQQNTRIYYFSDMYQASPESKRFFESTPPSSQEEALKWANKDAQIVKKTQSENNVFEDLEVQIFTSASGTRSSSLKVIQYWRALFKELGVKRNNIEYN